MSETDRAAIRVSIPPAAMRTGFYLDDREMLLLRDLTQISISAEATRQALKRAIHGAIHGDRSVAPVIYFPSRASFYSRLNLHQLATPWEHDTLEGLRLSDFRGTGLRLLTRAQKKVIWSKDLPSDVIEQIVTAFCERIDNLLWGLISCGAFAEETEAVLYSADLLAALLKASFVEPLKPRLVPRVKWIADTEAAALMRSLVPSLPWRKTDHSGSYSLTEESGNHIFEVRGERGEIELRESSSDADEIRLKMFDYFLRRDYLDKDENFTFDSMTLRPSARS